MRKKIFLFLALLLLAASAVQARSYMAQLCDSCSFGDRKKYCIKCGHYTFGHGAAAVLCESCAFGDRKKHCIKCGRYLFD